MFEFLLIPLAILFLLVTPAMAITAIVQISKLSRRVFLLEKALRDGVPEPASEEKPETAKPMASRRPAKALKTDEEKEWKATPPPPSAPPPKRPRPPKKTGKPGMEETLGTRWTVWLGGVALALGGIFLVRYSIEKGLIGPEVRVFMAAVFAGLLIAAGEFARRKDIMADIAGLPSAYIPGVLTGAGIITAFATVYVAYGVYGFIGPLFAFILLAGVALLSLAASAIHGPGMAALGLAGSYLTPALVSTDAPSAWGLFPYLLFVTAASYYVARTRGWLWLAVGAAIGAVAWGFIWNATHWTQGDVLPCALYVLTLTGLSLALLRMDGKKQDWPVIGVLAIISLLGTALLRLDLYSNFTLGVFAAIVIIHLAAAWRWTNLSALTVWAAGLFGFAYLTWHIPLLLTAMPSMGPFDAEMGLKPVASPGLARFLVTGAAFGALFGGAGFFGVIRERAHPYWAAIGVVAPLAIIIYAYLRATHFEHSVSFGLAAVLLAAVFAGMAEYINRTGKGEQMDWSTGIYAAASAGAIALAMTILLEKGWLSIALAIMCPVLAYIASQRPVPILRFVAAGMAAVVAARLLYNPVIIGDDPGSTPIFNWLLYGYGVPALAFGGAAMIFRRQRDDFIVQLFEAATILFVTALMGMQVRHLLNGGDVYASTFNLQELAIHTIIWLGLSIGLQRLHGWYNRPVFDWASMLLGGAGLAAGLIGLLLIKNPLFQHESIGANPVFNTLILAYLIPAILCGLLYRETLGKRHEYYVMAAGAGALILAFAYLTLEVRTFFHGTFLDRGITTDGEMYAYSAVWLLFGLTLLGAGIWRRAAMLRYASFAVIMLTVCKVFLFDMSNLTGIFRALSFIGLGGVLVGIGLLYQKVVFPKAVEEKKEQEI